MNKLPCWQTLDERAAESKYSPPDKPYTPVVPPVADTEELTLTGGRLILRHASRGGKCGMAELIYAPVGVLTAGWVIGLYRDANN